MTRRLGLLALLLLAGCAFNDRKLRLPPPAAPPRVAGGAPAVALVVEDARPEPRKVLGPVRNGYGAPTADVWTDDDPAAWLRAAVQAELASAGLRAAAPGEEAPLLVVRLARLGCDSYVQYAADAEVEAELRDGPRVLEAWRASGSGSAGLDWGSTAESYARSLALAMEDAAHRIAARSAARLGVPAAPATPPPAVPGVPR